MQYLSLQQTHEDAMDLWHAEREGRERAERYGHDMRKAAEKWCLQAKENAEEAEKWQILAMVLLYSAISHQRGIR